MHDTRRLSSLLSALQDSTGCQGFEALAQGCHNRNRRTLYRWRRAFGQQLRVVPSFTLQRLGLVHLHLLITNPKSAWLRFPYAVEHAWVTSDFVNNHLYLHCVVPQAHQQLVRALLQECRDWCTGLVTTWTADGWQELPGITPESIPVLKAATDTAVLHDEPLVVPVVFEAWGAQSMTGIWDGIRARVRHRLRQYLRRGKIYGTNGKLHVRHTYDRLSQQGLFRQYLVRYQGWATGAWEVIVVLRHAGEYLAELAEALRPHAVAIETYAGNDGAAVVRIAGTEEVNRTLLALQDDLQRYDARIFVHNARRANDATVRFCYELLFDPSTGEWVFPHDAIIDHMRDAA